mmetsp:Transcript_9348/g.22427  ORF Transcript_9348/g.22427 Transcript_9348/m.22427 type:complete len:233 (+) Transcript_9348:404-1102(+)
MCDMRFVTPAFSTAATESPPPMTVVQPRSVRSASMCATASVPAANASISKTPIGPFHTTVPAPSSSARIASTLRGPTSRPIRPAGIAPTVTTCAGASASSAGATTASTGRSSRTPRASACSSSATAISSCASSTSEEPTSWPSALRNVKHIAPPTTIESHFSTSDESTGSFDDTLAPPTIATSGRAGLASTASFMYSSSFCISRPATECSTCDATPAVDACARCAVPNASFT